MKKPLSALALAALVTCGHGDASPTHSALEGDQVARVGEVSIPASLVADVAARQGVSPAVALERLTGDSLASQAARARGVDSRPDVAWSMVSARARFCAERLERDAHAKGPPTDAEIDEATKRRWREFDMPEHMVVVHAVTLRKRDADVAIGPGVASAIHAAVLGAADGDAFQRAAKSVDASGLEVRVEVLPAFAEDGRVVDGDSNFDTTFTHAAFALANVGDTSSVVETKFGWHVIRLLQRFPAHRVPLAERRVALAESAYTRRARDAYEAILTRRKSSSGVSIEPSAYETMATLSVP